MWNTAFAVSIQMHLLHRNTEPCWSEALKIITMQQKCSGRDNIVSFMAFSLFVDDHYKQRVKNQELAGLSTANRNNTWLHVLPLCR